MTIATVLTKASHLSAVIDIQVEVSLSNGLPAFHIVGLPEKSVKESKDRVRSAITNCGFKFPNKRITVNLTPGDIPKYGTHYDLPIAIGILIATGSVPYNTQQLQRTYLFGELGLDGKIKTNKGILSCLLDGLTKKQYLLFSPHQPIYKQLIEPPFQLCCAHLMEALSQLDNTTPHTSPSTPTDTPPQSPTYSIDIREVKQQFLAKKALAIAAAGGHHMLMFGPPGVGKSMLAERLITLLPPLSKSQSIEVMCLYDQAKIHRPLEQMHIPPFRTPHHIISAPALVGGGMPIEPGEVSLAHHGVLFLDELGQFHKNTLDALREPIEKKSIQIKRTRDHQNFPANFQLIAAMNPPEAKHTPHKLSDAILDRIDITIELATLNKKDILFSTPKHTQNPEEPNSQTIRSQVTEARSRQYQRQGTLNAQVPFKTLEQKIQLTQTAKHILGASIDKFGFSVRTSHKIIRLAATICDLEKSTHISDNHIAQALQLKKQLSPNA